MEFVSKLQVLNFCIQICSSEALFEVLLKVALVDRGLRRMNLNDSFYIHRKTCGERGNVFWEICS